MVPVLAKFTRIGKNQLIAGSFVMMVGSLTAGFGNYLYHLLMGRMLGPVNYGILASLIALVYLLSIPISTLNLVVVKFISALKGQKKIQEIGLLFKYINQKLISFSLLTLLIFLLLTPLLSQFLHLDSLLPLIIVGVASWLGVFLAINRGTLQGLLRFPQLATAHILEVSLKLGFAVLLVFLGFKVYGALVPFIIGGVIAYAFTLFCLRSLLQAKDKETKPRGKEMARFALPVFFSNLAFISLYTSDIVLVRHFLSGQEAGFYAALGTLGKIIYFAAYPIVLVMFPMVSERHANGKKYFNLLKLSSGLVLLICLGISFVYFCFPELMIEILYGRQYLPASSHLSLFAIFLSFYCFSYLLTNFYLSIKKVRIVILPIIAAGLQILFISLFHQDLSQVIKVSIFVSGFLLLGLMLYYWYDQTKTALRHHSRL